MINPKEVVAWSHERIEVRVAYLRSLSDIATRRAIQVGSDAVQSQVEELEARLAAVRASYLDIDVSGYPNVVVAALASLQGQEREIHVQMAMWKNAKDVKKDLDEEIAICEKVLIERATVSRGLRQ